MGNFHHTAVVEVWYTSNGCPTLPSHCGTYLNVSVILDLINQTGQINRPFSKDRSQQFEQFSPSAGCEIINNKILWIQSPCSL